MGRQLETYFREFMNGIRAGHAFDPEADREQWRTAAVARLKELLGGFPEEKAPLAPVATECVALDGYTRERVEITTFEGLRMPMYVLTPERAEGPLPAVIACHGHGYGVKDIVGLEPDGSERRGDPGLHKDFAVALARRGFLVVAPELLGFGERRFAEDAAGGPKANSCFRIAAHLLMAGKTLAGYRTFETLRAVDYLEGRADGRADRVGIMGISGGGLVAAFAAAVDERLRAAVVSGYANTFQGSILDRNHCIDNYIPGLSAAFAMSDAIGLVAPRPLLIESGDKDKVFPRGPAIEAYEALRAIYAAYGAEDRLRADFFSGGHEIGGAVAYDWLASMLGDGEEAP
ncbi:alpha/beta hydrolase family protein [Paenibacillus sp.]|uniref:alpha/beta hydrolase n=1 Tax=Paenibacillus sp. TaxID=58172 RepID=UPI002811C647|nr:alpha/beta hydrolase family protein [Paenibacillus sp.]